MWKLIKTMRQLIERRSSDPRASVSEGNLPGATIRRTIGCLAGALVIALHVGCDPKPADTGSTSTNTTAPVTTTPIDVPTAARRVPLGVIPFSVELPGDWAVEPNTDATAIVIRGPKLPQDPEGLIVRQGRIVTHGLVSTERFESTLAEFRKIDSDLIDITVHEKGDIRVIERVERIPAIPTQTNANAQPNETQPTDNAVQPPPVDSTSVLQTFYIYAPGEEGKLSYNEINFTVTDPAEYQSQLPTLQAIIQSLEPAPLER